MRKAVKVFIKLGFYKLMLVETVKRVLMSFIGLNMLLTRTKFYMIQDKSRN